MSRCVSEGSTAAARFLSASLLAMGGGAVHASVGCGCPCFFDLFFAPYKNSVLKKKSMCVVLQVLDLSTLP